MKTYVRRENRDKRVTEIANFMPHKQPVSSSSLKPCTDLKESATIKESIRDETKGTEADILDVPLAQWIPSRNKRKAVSLKNPSLKVSLAKLVPAQLCNESDADEQTNGTSAKDLVPGKSTSTMSRDIFLTPGSVIWAKLDRQMWWPAEVLIRELTLNSHKESTQELVLVDYFGIEKSGWVNATRDISPFEECFEERSCKTSEEFQEAVKQALHKMKQSVASSEGHACYDLANPTNLSRTETDEFKKGTDKKQKQKVKKGSDKKLKQKVCINDVCSQASAKESLRLRIM